MFSNSNKPAGGANTPAKKPVIRRVTERVAVNGLPQSNGLPKPQQPSAKAPPNRFQLSNRASPKPVATSKKQAKPQPAVQKVVAQSRNLKRKSTTPERVQFSSEEDNSSDDDTSASDISRKRFKSGSDENDGPSRKLLLESAFQDTLQDVDIMHGADATSGDYANKFNNAFYADEFSTVELQYPSNSPRESFQLKWPKNENDDYKPMTDIVETIKTITSYYFPEPLRQKHMSDETGWDRRFNHAWKHESIPEIIAIVEEFNELLRGLVKDGTIRRELSLKRRLPLDLISRITEQIYSRTVSPKVETLRAYQNGSDYVYGELRERFCSQIFEQTKMHRDMVFVDLGSGVGNVVLQAALEVGCESWGVEIMKNPCDLAELQAKEFPERAKLWGIDCGKVKLLRGDFTDNPEIYPVLKRADVVLVNNQAFTPALNAKLGNLFLDLKEGCKVVSLKPFVPEGHKITPRNVGNVANVLVQERYDYFSGCVSWTDQHGHYYIAVRDGRPLEAFFAEQKARRAV